MKNIFSVLLVLGFTIGAWAGSSKCDRDFMKDACASDGYSIVETEPFVKAPHNCMAIAHYFPGEEPSCYCGHCGKNVAHPVSRVARVD